MSNHKALADYRCLLRRAGGGVPLADLDTIQEDPLGQIIGRGMLSDENLMVFDRVQTRLMLDAEARMRVVAALDGALHVSVALSWRTLDERNHTASAVWQASPNVVKELAAGRAISGVQLERESLATADPGTLVAAVPGFFAKWSQSLPGYKGGEVEDARAAGMAKYHLLTVADVVRRHPWLGLLVAYIEPFSLSHLVPLHDYSQYMMSTVPAC